RARGDRPILGVPAAAGEAGERAPASLAAPLAVIRAAHVQEKGTEKGAEKPAEKAADKAFDGVPSASSVAPRTTRVREAQNGVSGDAGASNGTSNGTSTTSSGSVETSADVGAALPVRAADAGH
ncbi:hypothetical protein G3N97_38685, partial [Paraburkholderia sp. Ac-20347]|nr:hypothetical protein [Paraburkholderia sp. Ac-20347]